MRIILAAALAALAACRPSDDPAARYRAFAEAARSGDDAAVWSMLASESQERIKARAGALAAGGATPGVNLAPEQLVLGDLAVAAPKVKSVEVVRRDGDAAVVEVEDAGGGRGQVEMRREKDGWKVVLPGG